MNNPLKKTIDVVIADRTVLDLPATQVCSVCKTEKSSDDYKVAGRANPNTPPALESICKQCVKDKKDQKDVLVTTALKRGHRPFADALLKYVTAKDGEQMDLLVKAVVVMALASDTDCMKYIIHALDGGATVTHTRAPELPIQLPPQSTVNNTPQIDTESRDMLSRLMGSAQSNTVTQTVP